MTSFNRKKETYSTILLSECKVDHKECPITYYKGRIKEMCMCRCHSHSKPPIREPEPIVGIHLPMEKDIH